MSNYYIEKDNKIILFDIDKERLTNTIKHHMSEFKDLQILQTERPIAQNSDNTYFEFADTDEYIGEQKEQRKNEFNSEFFNTSLGYIRRQVNMKDGSIKNFLTDILPLLEENIPIITYNIPDFSTDDKPSQNTNVLTTKEFLDECKQQLLRDFYGAQNNA